MTEPQSLQSLTSAASEERFRQIFFAHLEADGFTEADAYRMIFKTPEKFHQAPSPDHGPDLLDASRQSYRQQLAYGWFFEGLNRKPAACESCLQAPDKPVTFVVVPGIFGEFIEQLPFHEVLERKDSRFASQWQAALDQAPDEVYSLLELKNVPCKLSDTVKIASIDQGGRSFADLIVLNAQGGSLETLGSLASNAQVFQQRLSNVFELIEGDTDIYLVGYSRGLAVALELVSSLHEQERNGQLSGTDAGWFKRLRGVVGLGGVYYGANFAHQALAGKSGATSDLVRLICEISGGLMTVPDDANLAEKTEIVANNAKVWADFVKRIKEGKPPKVADGKSFLDIDLGDAFAREGKARILGRDVPVPSPWGIFSLVSNFFLQTFNLKKFVSSYNENILGFKQLVEAVVTGVHTLTPASRDEWWRDHDLPERLVLLSITGSMPDAYLNDFGSPLWHFEGFGARTSDYNVSLRASYYDTVFSEETLINDSQVSHFCSRYWEEMYPQHRYPHYYLGVLGTHHWGMAFPFTIRDDRKNGGGNAFPRAILLKSVASFISSLERQEQ